MTLRKGDQLKKNDRSLSMTPQVERKRISYLTVYIKKIKIGKKRKSKKNAIYAFQVIERNSVLLWQTRG